MRWLRARFCNEINGSGSGESGVGWHSAVCVSRDPCLEGTIGPFSREGTSVGQPACQPRPSLQFLWIRVLPWAVPRSPVPTPVSSGWWTWSQTDKQLFQFYFGPSSLDLQFSVYYCTIRSLGVGGIETTLDTFWDSFFWGGRIERRSRRMPRS